MSPDMCKQRWTNPMQTISYIFKSQFNMEGWDNDELTTNCHHGKAYVCI